MAWPAAGQEAAPKAATTPAREKAALAFVDEHHPELARLLANLKAMSRAEYDRAIADLDRARTNLANVRKRDAERHAADLALWKAKSRLDLLTAQLAAEPRTSPERDQELREAIDAHLAAQVEQQKLERDRLRERLKSLEASLEAAEGHEKEVGAARHEAATKRVQRLRKQAAAKPGASPKKAAAKPTPKKSTEKPRTDDDTDRPGPAGRPGTGE
jgi:ATP-dependent Lon protease